MLVHANSSELEFNQELTLVTLLNSRQYMQQQHLSKLCLNFNDDLCTYL